MLYDDFKKTALQSHHQQQHLQPLLNGADVPFQTALKMDKVK
jgi:hypothetical protein